MQLFIIGLLISCSLSSVFAEDTRLIELEPDEAAQILNKQDQSLRYAPKIESNVPGVRFIGNHPEQVVEDIYLANQYHGQDGLGAYVYGYSVPDIAKTEKKERSGDLKGAYNYIGEDGKEVKVEYWDNGTGFHQIDNVPRIQPKQVEDAPDVKAAKEEHLRIWHEQAERNSHAPPDPYANQYNQPQQPIQNQYQQYQPQPQPQPQPHPYSSQTPGVTHYQAQAAQPQQQPAGQPAGAPFPAGAQLQPGQYQQPHAQVQVQHSVPSQISPNSVEYSGQYSTNQQTWVQQPGAPTGAGAAPATGPGAGAQYSPGSSASASQHSSQQAPQEEEEDQTGPPKGFFYSFDYPVGIIVGREGKNLEAYYSQNKNLFEKQLTGEAPRPSGSSNTYAASA